MGGVGESGAGDFFPVTDEEVEEFEAALAGGIHYRVTPLAPEAGTLPAGPALVESGPEGNRVPDGVVDDAPDWLVRKIFGEE